MTENHWLPIDTMPLSAVGTEVDVLDRRRLYSGVEISGIRLEREVLVDRDWSGDETVYLGDIEEFTITHTAGTIQATLGAEWRPHV